MPVHNAEAIVLRHYSLSDSDRIIVLFSREFGKIRAVAKGAKKPRNRLSGSLEPLTHIRLVFWEQEGRELSKIQQTEFIHAYLGKNPDLRKMAAFSYFAELANELVQDNQPNHALFRLFLATLKAGDSRPVSEALIRYYEVWCLKLSGLFPDYAYCSNCGKCVKDDIFFAWIQAGQAQCPDCSGGQGVEVGAPASRALSLMMTMAPGKFISESLGSEATQNLERLLQRLLDMHLEKKLKSVQILKEALENE